jgi:hypothetical protein
MTKYEEAIGWMEQASELLDQAHASLRDLGLHDVWDFKGSRPYQTIDNLVKDVDRLVVRIKEERANDLEIAQ